jgi:hypothetical protein
MSCLYCVACLDSTLLSAEAYTELPHMKSTTLILLLLACSPVSAQVASDEAAIRSLATRWEQSWNQHDMKQLFGLVTDDADFVNVKNTSGS